jgi:3-methyladenine DNA glycosylase AlkD
VSGQEQRWADGAVAAAVHALEPLADRDRAGPMARYLRGQFPFLGIGRPALDAALRACWHGLPVPTPPDLAAAAEALWALPHREYQYAAIALLQRLLRPRTGLLAVPGLLAASALGPGDVAPGDGLVERLITNRPWWDTVDALRKAAVGPLVAANPAFVAVTDRWIEADDRWLVRSAIIHQLGYRERTDAERLFAYCTRRAADREFFVAKAIGWALRTHARTDPDGVRTFVAARPELTPLARREALKHL